jgi:hypothetical protein
MLEQLYHPLAISSKMSTVSKKFSKLIRKATRQVAKKKKSPMASRRGKAKPRRAFGSANLRSISGSKGGLSLGSSNRGSTNRRGQIIEEDEYIAEVSGSVSFATTAYQVNIGQQGTFPWAYKIAALYEKYDFEFLEFYYRREVSEYASNGQVGKVILSFDYDASDAAPTTKQQVEDTEPHVDGMPCVERLGLTIDCRQARNQDSKYVRPGSQPANTDIKTYDIGTLYVSTQGCTNTTNIGELRVRYRCRLHVPVLEAAGSAQPGALNTFTVVSAPAGEKATTSNTYQILFPSSTSPVILTNGVQATIDATGFITLPAGKYLLNASCQMNDSSAGPSASGFALYSASATQQFLSSTFGDSASNSSNTSQSQTGWFASINNVIWDTFLLGTTVYVKNNVTFASGTCYNWGYFSAVFLGAVSTTAIVKPHPRLSGVERELLDVQDLMKQELALLRQEIHSRHRVDSDFDDDEQKSSLSGSTDLSKSTVEFISELVARKSSSLKK